MIKTKASMLQGSTDKDFKVVKFEGIKKLPKTQAPQQNNDPDSDEMFDEIFGDGPSRRKKPKKAKNEVTYDKARREVMNFGIAGANAANKSDQITQLLIKLGAKPPKKQSRNYKEILKEKRKQKIEDGKVNKRAIFGTSATLQYKNQKKIGRKKNDGLLKSYGRVNKKDLPQKEAGGRRKR